MQSIQIALILLLGYAIFVAGYWFVTGHCSNPTTQQDPNITTNMDVLPAEEDLPGVEENEAK